ncbi:MAG: hypothetical protein WBI07_07605 [Mobilitalea sp.]
MRVSKFIDLTKYFENSNDTHITLSFAEIEKIIGLKLCLSAYQYVPYWHHSKTHVITNTWMGAGYSLESVDLVSKRVSFIKIY